ncbi:hypothetical protein O181_051240 [Austropuccinia psidii MF-1]|uniref:Uncharacterized protein n=1 Tax=Austropuccinia psidii MF-1 TaxID=1389203 RepID=A0A9Q3HRM0_9BASI|nr:hypothetical protein [Austropuccinia psidii MF-1]
MLPSFSIAFLLYITIKNLRIELSKLASVNLLKKENYYSCLEEVEEAPMTEDHPEDKSISSELGHEEPEQPPKKKIKVIGARHPTLIHSDIGETNILPYCNGPATHFTHSDPCTFNEALKSKE